MKILLVVLGIGAAVALSGSRAEAQNYPWCAYYSGGDEGGGTNCGFVSFQQCMASVSGIGGFCQRNNLYHAPGGPSGRRHSRRY